MTTAKITRKIVKVSANQITVDSRVQRPLDEKRVQKIVAAFNWDSLGVPTVSARDDGTMVVLDGQTRFGALLKLGHGSVGVSCIVYEGLSVEEEAQRFRELNDSKRLTAADLFRVAITEEDPIAVGANKALELYGWRAAGGYRNTFSAVNTAYRLFERDEKTFRRALELLSRAWGPCREAAAAALLTGAYEVLFRYGDAFKVDVDNFAQKLAREPGGPSQILGRARGQSQTRGIKVPDAVADILVNTYNKGRKGRTGELPGWAN